MFFDKGQYIVENKRLVLLVEYIVAHTARLFPKKMSRRINAAAHLKILR